MGEAGCSQHWLPHSLPNILAQWTAMKNFHLPLPEQMCEGRHDQIAAWATEMAGSSLDLDCELEAAGIEHLIETGKTTK